ncbi:hypothetical protein RHGRI_033529 [Rhododendron griersonianum]|uniref:Uncharacterized protein n=1 Tax=Rhododendron griersonianum TaxID=479676 RepID=A0AAV6I2V1_9ERIC|nr:hypothetical protein RHGRI_033529 [Rhododendron griersonianum]
MLMLCVSNGVGHRDERDVDFLTLFADGRCDGVPATTLTEFCNCSKSNNLLKMLFSKEAEAAFLQRFEEVVSGYQRNFHFAVFW